MKLPIDLHLCSKSIYFKEMIEKASELGYKAIGVTISQKTKSEEILKLKEVCNSLGIDFVTRIDLIPKSVDELLRNLRVLRKKTEIIAVECLSKQIARQAAKDRRVDLISFPSINPRKRFFDEAEAKLASVATASLEIDMASLLILQGFKRSLLLLSLRREIIMANRFHVPIVLSSGAEDPILLRSAEDYCNLAYLFGMKHHEARKAFSDTPKAIINRNRMKLSQNFLAPGVFLVNRRRRN